MSLTWPESLPLLRSDRMSSRVDLPVKQHKPVGGPVEGTT